MCALVSHWTNLRWYIRFPLNAGLHYSLLNIWSNTSISQKRHCCVVVRKQTVTAPSPRNGKEHKGKVSYLVHTLR